MFPTGLTGSFFNKMKRFIILIAAFSFLSFLVIEAPIWAQTPSPNDDHTAREENEGKQMWEKLQAKQIECKNLTDDNYQALGEYFMGQSIGDTKRHALMNQMMTGMMGKEGEEQMHVVMGKRLSGCQLMGSAFARWPSGFGETKGGDNPMMGYGSWNNMMGEWNGFGILGFIPMLLFWILLILGVVALLRYLGRSGQQQNHRTPLDILKERYARGEIDKKELEEMKKDLR